MQWLWQAPDRQGWAKEQKVQLLRMHGRAVESQENRKRRFRARSFENHARAQNATAKVK